ITEPRPDFVSFVASRDAQLMVAALRVRRLWIERQRVLRTDIACDRLDCFRQFLIRPWKERRRAGFARQPLKHIARVIDQRAVYEFDSRSRPPEQIFLLPAEVTDGIDLDS